MNIKDLRASLEFLFKAEVTPFIWGHAGIGKSTVVKDLAKNLGYKFFPFYLGTMSDVGDILGLATFIKDLNGQEIATAFAPPIWLKDMIDYCIANPNSGAVIFLDEFNRGRRDILNGMFSLALDKTFHTIKLPKNCHIVAAGNPDTDEYFTTDVNETALMARFAHIKLEPSFNEWVDFAHETKIESSLVSFLQEQPGLLADAKSSFSLPVKVDNRSWERIDRLFKVGTPEGLLDQLMIGIIGAERLVAYKAHLKNHDKPIAGEAIFSGDLNAFKTVQKWSNPDDIKSSLLSNTNDNIAAFLKAQNDTVLTEKQIEHLVMYAELIPKDMAFVLLDKLYKDNAKCIKSFFSTDSVLSLRLAKVVKAARGKEEEAVAT